jgi:hypothetical protein
MTTDSLDSKKLERMRIRAERLKGWATIAAIVASLATGIGAYFKEEEDKGAKDVYKELSVAVEKVSEDQIRLHRDVSAIRGYLAGKAKEPSPAIVEFLTDPVPAPAPRRATSRRPESNKPKAKAIIEEEPIDDVPSIEPPPVQYEAPPVEQVTKK